MVDARKATDLIVKLLGEASISYSDPAGETHQLDPYDIYGGYVGDRARRASIIVQPSTRSPEYAEEQLLPIKVSETFTIAINVVSRTFSKNQQDQLLSVCDQIEAAVVNQADLNVLDDQLAGENYISVVSTDYNDEIQFGTRRGENVATIYVSVYTNPHIGLERP